VRQTLGAGKCDVVMGYAQGDELVLNTNHYYTSTHVLVVRADSELAGVDALEDPRLQGKKIGVVAGAPPASHVARLGLMKDARPYDLMVDRRVENPAGAMLADVADGTTDGALMWGPIAGPLVKDNPDLVAVPLLKEEVPPRLVYRITMGVRAGEDVWKRELNSLIRREQPQIDAVLRDAGVPILDDFGRGPKPQG
jgi:quinoprotein dehydrogenase-associated probable ABC transporter substrate-binding protein